MSSRRTLGAATAVAGLAMMMGAVLLAPEAAEATHSKVMICHATNAATDTNPYNSIEVSYDAIDGWGQNDHSHHVGDVAVWYPGAKADGKTWGDIIPPVPWVIPLGLNWTTAGQALWNNECVPPVIPTTTTVPATTTTVQPTTTTTEPPTTTTEPPTTTTEAVTTTTEAVTTTTEAVTTTTEAVTTTSVDSGGPTTTLAATTTSLASGGPTTTVTSTTALGDQGGTLPTTGAGTSPILFLGALTLLGGLTIMALGRRTV